MLRDACLPACSVTHLPQSAAPPLSSPVSTAPRQVTSWESCLARDGARLYDQCHELLDGLGFHPVAYGAVSPFWGDPSRVIGNAIAVRHPMVSADATALPRAPGAWEPRSEGGRPQPSLTPPPEWMLPPTPSGCRPRMT